jgi:hypothetical protein
MVILGVSLWSRIGHSQRTVEALVALSVSFALHPSVKQEMDSSPNVGWAQRQSKSVVLHPVVGMIRRKH